MRIKIKEADIQLALSYRHVYKGQLAVPNVTMSWGECDLLAVSLAGYVTEYEVKISIADLKREWKKQRWNPDSFRWRDSAYEAFQRVVKFYWIAVPENLVAKAKPLIPDHIGAGLISIGESSHFGGAFRGWRVLEEVHRPRLNRKAKALTPERWIQLGHKGTVKYWNLARKSVKEK